MRVGFVGLGRMGANMARRLLADGHEVVVANRSRGPVDELAAAGALPAYSLEELVAALPAPRIVWLMLPPGDPTESQIALLRPLLGRGDVIIEGGNSNFRDDARRALDLAADGIGYLDAGTSGGVWGRELGYTLMVGGERADYELAHPIFVSLAPAGGELYTGPSGSGHYAKMIHNGIEYGLMEAYAEGFEILRASDYPFDVAAMADLWNHGSVIRSWLLELAAAALASDPDLASIKGYVEDTGEGRWTAIEAIEHAVPAPVITAALQARFRSRQDDSFAAKVTAAMRAQFGGHPTKPSDPSS
jgi:6-phosphogluconate dehydrogenase